MPAIADRQVAAHSSSSLARRALWFGLLSAWSGAALGLVGAAAGTVARGELILVSASLLFSTAAILKLALGHRAALQQIATASMAWFSINLIAGMIISVFGRTDHMNLFIYLIWFFPLLAFNKLVNSPEVGRFFARFLLIAPLLSVACLSPWLIPGLKMFSLIMLAVFCLCYAGFGMMFDIVTRYREEFLVEQERVESLRLKSDILESISDCFFSLDADQRILFLNDAACAEFGVQRHLVLGQPIAKAVPDFCSPSMRCALRAALSTPAATNFDAEGNHGDVWYRLRCYPRNDGISIYFRNITELVLSQRELEQAHAHLREQAALLDKAKDAIFVVDGDLCITYWNRGAERLYGWSSADVMGLPVNEVFHYDLAELGARTASLLRDGEWIGEIPQRHSDGSVLIVESHCSVVNGVDGGANSILAINTDITKRKVVEARVERLAFYDPLTELPNRQLLRERLERAIAASARQAVIGAVLLIDLDDFQALNDTLGHEVGDELLRLVATRLISCAFTANTVARLGGDEFAVLLDKLGMDERAASAAAIAVAESILDAFLQPYDLGIHSYDCTTSIGIALFTGCDSKVDTVLKQADMALYRAKAQGVNTLACFDPAMEVSISSRLALRSDLRRAMEHHEFELHYQPQLDSNKKVVSAEALLRWRHPRRGMVPPNEFIPVAEEAGLIVALGRWVLETACSQLATWAADPATARISVAVNISLRQFLDSQFVGTVLEVLRITGANPRRLKLEITESSMLNKVDETILKMESLKHHGIGFSLDDFGTGYSSLSHLKRLPLDQLKIDRSFVMDALENSKDASIVRTIIALGRNLNLTVIAEGVETEQQRSFLEEEGCFLYQGFLFSRALAPLDFETFVSRANMAFPRITYRM